MTAISSQVEDRPDNFFGVPNVIVINQNFSDCLSADSESCGIHVAGESRNDASSAIFDVFFSASYSYIFLVGLVVSEVVFSSGFDIPSCLESLSDEVAKINDLDMESNPMQMALRLASYVTRHLNGQFKLLFHVQ